MTYLLTLLQGIGLGTLVVWTAQLFRYVCDRIEKRIPPPPPRFTIRHWNGCVSDYGDSEADHLAVLSSILMNLPWHRRPRA